MSCVVPRLPQSETQQRSHHPPPLHVQCRDVRCLEDLSHIHLVPPLREPHVGGEDVGESVAVPNSNAPTNVLSTRVRFHKRGHQVNPLRGRQVLALGMSLQVEVGKVFL